MKALPLALLISACILEVPTTISDPPADTGEPSTSPGDSGDTAAPETSDPFERDDDGDGYSENDGDCDDADPAVHPGQEDACNGVDDDCDGELEEDARADDIYEPNDGATEWFYLGSLADTGSYSVSGLLHNDDDLDRFSFYTDDPWYSSFGIEVSLTNIPADATYRLQLGLVADDGSLDLIASDYGGGELSLRHEGTGGVDDAGTYGVLVDAVGGADCGRSYLLTVTGD